MGTLLLLLVSPFILAGMVVGGITKAIMNYDKKEATKKEVAKEEENDEFRFPTAKEAIEGIFEATDEVEQDIKKAGVAGLKALGKIFKELGEE